MITIHDYLNTHLKQHWNKTRLQTLAGSPFLQDIDKELDSLVNKPFTLKQLDDGYKEAKNIENIKEVEDIVAAFIFNMSNPV
ncbi:hypothetical protein [Paenibacillus sp. Soil522]|uniref:hypothetical protein n=1 Tax=Paenibacillus sp. Soil522 TaxID=1736388 RepID=UPI0006F5D349|nr:hypothetical protein [Paenibacillus sp. Soil522]KRE45818.1 hypothetical protein ASG81_12375 [Paenibacillus sp. Soil522]